MTTPDAAVLVAFASVMRALIALASKLADRKGPRNKETAPAAAGAVRREYTRWRNFSAASGGRQGWPCLDLSLGSDVPEGKLTCLRKGPRNLDSQLPSSDAVNNQKAVVAPIH